MVERISPQELREGSFAWLETPKSLAEEGLYSPRRKRKVPQAEGQSHSHAAHGWDEGEGPAGGGSRLGLWASDPSLDDWQALCKTRSAGHP